MSQPNWPGTAGFPAIPYRGAWTEKSVQLPFATGNGESAATTPKVFWGTGSPNGVLTGKPGDLAIQTDGVAGLVTWQKASGTNTNTGWSLLVSALITGQVFVDEFGAKGDGVTDDTVPVQNAENARTAGQILKFTPGKVYAIAATAAANLLRNAHTGYWDLAGASLKYTGASNISTGSDSAALALVNVLVTPFAILGGPTAVLDCNSKMNFPIAIQGAQTGGFRMDCTVTNLLETGGTTLTGVAYTLSQDLSGIPISGARATYVSGILYRPNCPVINASGSITAHAPRTIHVYAGDFVIGNTTGYCTVSAGSEGTIMHMVPGAGGALNAIGNTGTAIGNGNLNDGVFYDLGSRHQERYGAVLDLPQRQSFGTGGAYTPGWLDNSGGMDANHHVITVTANVVVTINNPSNPAAISVDRVGRIYFTIRNTSGAGLSTAVSFAGASYRVTGTVSPGNNQEITVCVVWDQTTGLYKEIFRGSAVATV